MQAASLWKPVVISISLTLGSCGSDSDNSNPKDEILGSEFVYQLDHSKKLVSSGRC